MDLGIDHDLSRSSAVSRSRSAADAGARTVSPRTATALHQNRDPWLGGKSASPGVGVEVGAHSGIALGSAPGPRVAEIREPSSMRLGTPEDQLCGIRLSRACHRQVQPLGPHLHHDGWERVLLDQPVSRLCPVEHDTPPDQVALCPRLHSLQRRARGSSDVLRIKCLRVVDRVHEGIDVAVAERCRR